MLKMIRNLDYVILLCDDLAAMKNFYHDILGFPTYRDWGDWFEMQVGAVLLTLRPRERPYDGVHNARSAGVQLAFRVGPDEVQSCYEELTAKGVTILQPPQDGGYGHLAFFFADPEHNVLEIYADVAVTNKM
jgi:catechol 2,3-dioxygenase-like lactoylglutathione lyase family enzyme